jgi:hypothetical protein
MEVIGIQALSVCVESVAAVSGGKTGLPRADYALICCSVHFALYLWGVG